MHSGAESFLKSLVCFFFLLELHVLFGFFEIYKSVLILISSEETGIYISASPLMEIQRESLILGNNMSSGVTVPIFDK